MNIINDYQYITFFELCEYKGKVYTTNMLTNDLIQIDPTDMHVTKVIELPSSLCLPENDCIYFRHIFEQNGILHLLPDRTSRCVVTYDINNNKWEKGEPIVDGLNWDYISDYGCLLNNYYLMVVTRKKRLLVYDIKNMCFVEPSGRLKKFDRWIRNLDCSFSQTVHWIAGILYIGAIGKACVYYYDINNDDYGLISTPEIIDSELLAFAVDDDNYWLYCDGNRKILRLSKDNNNDYEFINVVGNIYPLIDCGDKLILCYWEKESFKSLSILDKKSRNIKNLETMMPKSIKCFDDIRKIRGGSFGGFVSKPGIVRLFPGATNLGINIDMRDLSISSYETRIDNDWIEHVYERMREYSKDGVLTEASIHKYYTQESGLSFFISSIMAITK